MKTCIVYELALHDYGNLAYQLLDVRTERKELDELADKMNFLFSQAGKKDEFEAMVHVIEQEEIGE